MENVSAKQGWLNRNWKWFVPVVAIVLILVCVGCLVLFGATIFGTIKSSDVYQLALARAQENTAAVAALGSPIEAGFFVSGSINVSGPSGSADLSIPVSGPKGSGTLYVVAKKSAGVWEFTTLELEVADSGGRIDILREQ